MDFGRNTIVRVSADTQPANGPSNPLPGPFAFAGRNSSHDPHLADLNASGQQDTIGIVKAFDPNTSSYQWTISIPRTGPGLVFDQHLSHEHCRRGISRIEVTRQAVAADQQPSCKVVAIPSGRSIEIIGPIKPKAIREQLDQLMGPRYIPVDKRAAKSANIRTAITEGKRVE